MQMCPVKYHTTGHHAGDCFPSVLVFDTQYFL